jgi:hypothetical protein
MIPMDEIVSELQSGEHCCSRELFALINRTLTSFGKMAQIEQMDDDLIWFSVKTKPSNVS